MIMQRNGEKSSIVARKRASLALEKCDGDGSAEYIAAVIVQYSCATSSVVVQCKHLTKTMS